MYSQHNQRILQIFDFLNNAYRMQKNSQRERERERERWTVEMKMNREHS